jgi:hypothetical protein
MESSNVKRGRGRPKSGLSPSELATRSKKNLDTKMITANGELLILLRQLQTAKSAELGIDLTIKQTLKIALNIALAT